MPCFYGAERGINQPRFSAVWLNAGLENMAELLRRFILSLACMVRKHEVAYAMIFWTDEDVKLTTRLRAVRETQRAVHLLKTARNALRHKQDLSFWPSDQ